MSIGTLVPRDAILVVDDNDQTRSLFEAYLASAGHDVVLASGGGEAIALVGRLGPDLGAVILDVHMPVISGFDVLRSVRARSGDDHLPIIVATADGDRTTKRRAAALGADEFLSKPVDQVELVARVRHLVRLRQVSRRMVSVQGIIDGLAAAIEERDSYTEFHTLRVAAFAARTAEALDMPPEFRLPLIEGAIIHDIGMIGVPDTILQSPRVLTQEEFQLVRQHVETGVRILSSIARDSIMLQVVRHHHERYDGTGYPDSLSADRIPLAARIVAVADSFDAMTSDRPYRPGHDWDEARRLLTVDAGRQWDPQIVHAFLRSVDADPILLEAARHGGRQLRQLVHLWRERLARQVTRDLL